MNTPIRTGTLIIAAGAMAVSAMPAQAQFRGLFRDAERGARVAEGCEDDSAGDTARGVIGGLLGGAVGRTARSAGLGSFVPVSRFSGELTNVIACKLNEEEQAQAAEATLQATRSGSETEGAADSAYRGDNGSAEGDQGPPVGQSASWTSQTREDVSGSSTVTAREQAGSEYEDCVTVTDIIIVEGEETRADKRMCRVAGAARYSIVA